jgi:hypothetical protein
MQRRRATALHSLSDRPKWSWSCCRERATIAAVSSPPEPCRTASAWPDGQTESLGLGCGGRAADQDSPGARRRQFAGRNAGSDELTARRECPYWSLRQIARYKPVSDGAPGWRRIAGICGAGRSKLGARAAPAGQGASNATGLRMRSIIHCSRAPPSGHSSSASGLLRGGPPKEGIT